MRTLFVLAAMAVFATATWARVWTTIYRHDEKTPLEAVDPNHPTVCRDIMTGTHLTIVVNSDQGGYWYGSLLVRRENGPCGVLQARGPADRFWHYAESCLYDAGDDAWVVPMVGPEGHGFQFGSTEGFPPDRDAVPGTWFIFDYYAQQAGPCQVDFYDYELDWMSPNETRSFTHVPSRDFNTDRTVDLRDFALLASQWRSATAPDPNNPDAALDLDADRSIDVNDLSLFGDFWLEHTDAAEPVVDPNAE